MHRGLYSIEQPASALQILIEWSYLVGLHAVIIVSATDKLNNAYDRDVDFQVRNDSVELS